jgi:O-antigen/teichoic acid export membrane protein
LRDELRHALVLALGTGISSLLRIAYVVYAARELGPAAYADLYAGLSLVFLFATGMAPISGTVSRFTSLYLAADDRGALAGLLRFARSQVRRIALGLVVLAPLLVLGLRSQLSSSSLLPPVLIAAILPLALLIDLPRGLLRGAQRFWGFSLNIGIEAAVRLGVSVALLARSATVGSALLAYLLAALVTLPLGAAQTRAVGAGAGAEDKPADGRLLRRFGANFFLVAFLGAAVQNIDVLAVRNLFPDLEAGLYSAASSIAKVVALIYLPFGVLLLPSLTARFASERQPERTLTAIMGAFAGVALVAVATLSLAGEAIVRLLFGADFVGAQPLIAPIGLAMTLAFLSIMLGQAFTAMNRFGFIPFYLAAVVAELIILWWTHASLSDLAHGLLVSQTLTFVVMLVCFVTTVRSFRPVSAE